LYQASFSFNGTAVWIFGAKRGNHGHYIVTIDNGQAERFDGYAPTQSDGTDGVYQVVCFLVSVQGLVAHRPPQPLFSKTDLKDGFHTVVLSNDGGADSGKPYVDIDFITWTSNDEA
jgi:hypothetical protein